MTKPPFATEEQAESWFWNHSGLSLDPLEDQKRASDIKDRIATLIAKNLLFNDEQARAFRRHVHVGHGTDHAGSYIAVTSSLTGAMYFFYEEDREETIDEFIQHAAVSIADDYRAERVELPSFEGVDPEKSWLSYVEEARQS